MPISPRAMQFLIEKAKGEVSQNRKVLSQANQNLQNQTNKMDTLRNYRTDCQTSLMKQGATTSISMSQLQNQLAFVEKIDQAIVQQNELIQYAKGSVLMGHRKLTRSLVKEQKFATLQNRYEERALQEENRIEQKMTDEFSGNKFARKMITEGA